MIRGVDFMRYTEAGGLLECWYRRVGARVERWWWGEASGWGMVMDVEGMIYRHGDRGAVVGFAETWWGAFGERLVVVGVEGLGWRGWWVG